MRRIIAGSGTLVSPMKPPVAAEPRPAPHLPSASVQLAWLSLAMFFGMTLWFSATAVNAAIVQEFQLTGAETAWLAMAVQAGFVIGTLIAAFLNLPDIISARRLFAVGCVLGAAANALVTLPGGPATTITPPLRAARAPAWSP